MLTTTHADVVRVRVPLRRSAGLGRYKHSYIAGHDGSRNGAVDPRAFRWRRLSHVLRKPGGRQGS